jgi:hypothetical protein
MTTIQTPEVLYTKLSRYNTSGNENGFIMEDFKKMNVPFTETFVRNEEENHPEILAQRIFGDARMWWVLCRFNGFSDPDNLPAGTRVRIPELNGIS